MPRTCCKAVWKGLNREYYLSDGDKMREIRAKYRAHVSAVLTLAGFNDAERRAQQIVVLERSIADKHIPFADEQNIQKANNAWKQADFAANAPGLDWAKYFRGAGLSQQAGFIVWQPKAFAAGREALLWFQRIARASGKGASGSRRSGLLHYGGAAQRWRLFDCIGKVRLRDLPRCY